MYSYSENLNTIDFFILVHHQLVDGKDFKSYIVSNMCKINLYLIAWFLFAYLLTSAYQHFILLWIGITFVQFLHNIVSTVCGEKHDGMGKVVKITLIYSFFLVDFSLVLSKIHQLLKFGYPQCTVLHIEHYRGMQDTNLCKKNWH